jgi:BolA family transcriptional regulator, general stress-responsive regulator
MGVGGRLRKASAVAEKPGRSLAEACETVEKPPMQTRADRIRQTLEASFAPARVEVRDDSQLHAGHAGAAPGGETHYSVLAVSPAFAGMNRVARSRAVHAVLEAEFGRGLHALALKLQTPEEAGGA